MESLSIDELPSLIFQLFGFSSKGGRKEILLGIINFFEKMEINRSSKKSKKELLRQLLYIQGTTLLHIDIAIKRDQVIYKIFVSL